MKKKLIPIIFSILAGIICAAGVSYSWFAEPNNNKKPSISGGIVTEYFHCGTGTADDPLVITRPVHYYRMVEFYQRETQLPSVVNENGLIKFGTDYLYFQIGCPEEQLYNPSLRPGVDFNVDENTQYYVFDYDDTNEIIAETNQLGDKVQSLNMQYYSGDKALMPTGSSEIPFCGQIDGKNITIYNLYITTSSTVIPHGETDAVTRTTSDVGIFGYVGAGVDVNKDGVIGGTEEDPTEGEKNKLLNLYFANVTIDVTGLSNTPTDHHTTGTAHYPDAIYDTEGNVTSTGDSVSYVGFLVGHISTSATCDGVYINDCTIVGGAEANCDYGFFGCVEDAETGAPLPEVDDIIKELRAQGDEAGFGGSMDMYHIYTRVNSIRNSNAQTSYKYLTAKTKIIDEKTNSVYYTDFKFDGTLSSTLGYDVRDDAGLLESLYLYNSTNSPDYVKFVSSIHSTTVASGQPTTVTTYTYTYKADSSSPDGYLYDDAIIMAYNGTYLCLTSESSATLTGTTSQDNAQPFVWEDGYLFTRVDGEKYYLTRSGNNITLSTTKTTTWSINDGDELTCIDNSTSYYLYYSNGWKNTNSRYTYYITDNNGHYLSTTTTAIQNATSEANSAKWILSNPSGNTTLLSMNSGSYLGVQNGSLVLSSTPTTWTKNGNGYFVTQNGRDFYLIYDNGWTVVAQSYELINDGNGNYLRVTGANTSANTTNQANATHFYFASNGTNPSGTVYCIVNGTIYYLYSNNGKLATTTSASTATSWSNDGSSLYTGTTTSGYCIAYKNNQWQLSSYGGPFITDGNGNYLRITGDSSFTNTTDITQASTFELDSNGRLKSTFNNKTVYLRRNSANLVAQTSTTSVTGWSHDQTSNCFKNGSYYLVYCSGIWQLFNASSPSGYLISYNGNYMSANGNTLTYTTNADDALIFSGTSGNISTTINGTTYYLNVSRNSASLSTSQQNLTNSNNKLSRNSGFSTYYIRYNNGWTVTTSSNSATTLTFTQVTRTCHSYLENNERENAYVEKITNSTVPLVALTMNTEQYALDFSDSKLQVIEKGDTTNNERIGTFFPIRTIWDDHLADDDTSNDTNYDYKTSQKNTGYIVSGGYEGVGQHSDIRISSYESNSISGSYKNGTLSTIYTYNDSGNKEWLNGTSAINAYMLQDETFNVAYTQFSETLKNSGSQVYGLHFMTSAISMDHIITVPKATILGKTYYNYQFPEDCIDFQAIERGNITLFAGNYYTQQKNNSFFSLHRIYRDANHNITAIKEISEVYERNQNGESYPCVYKYSDGTWSSDSVDLTQYTLVFKMSWLTNPSGIDSNTNRVYYFSIPCNAGEYALGSVSGKNGAYLMYLDIGANGGNSMSAVVTDKNNGVGNYFNVDYRYVDDEKEQDSYAILQIKTAVPTGSTNKNYSISVTFDSTDEGDTNDLGEIPHEKGLYTITIVNNTTEDIEIYALLCDNDDDATNAFPYAYRIVYTNSSNENQVIYTVFNADYWQVSAGFKIPPSGNAEELEY